MEKVFIIGLAIVAFGVGFLLHAWVSPIPSLFDISSSSRSLSSSSPSQFERFDSAVSSGYTDIAHNSIPTKMSLQGKVTDFNNTPIDDGNLGVKISDISSCTQKIFFDYNYFNVIQDGAFNLLLGDQNDLLKLNFNQDYFMCLYVNGEQLSGPQTFRGGQGEVHSEQLFDGNVSTPLDVNYLQVRNDLNVWGDIQLGCGRIYWDDVNNAINIQVNC